MQFALSLTTDPFGVSWLPFPPSCPFFSCAFVFSERVLPGALALLTELQETGQGILSLSS